MLDRWPSPIARRLSTNRTSPAAQPAWSGCCTIDGLNSAAASSAYCWVKYAPISRRRAQPTSISPPSRCATSPKLRSRVSSRSRYRPENLASVRASARAASSSLIASTRSITAFARDSPLIRVSCPGTNSRLSVRDASGRSRWCVRVSSPPAEPGLVTATRRSGGVPAVARRSWRSWTRRPGCRCGRWP